MKRIGNCNLIRINDPSQTPIPHDIEKPKPPKIKTKRQSKIKKKTTIPDRKVYVPKKIRKHLNWEEGERILFIEKDTDIILKKK